jgi:branched-chain amino acid transport system substrate-binding protein
MLSPFATDPCLTQQDPAAGCSGSASLLGTVHPTGKVTFFRIVPTDSQQGIVMADYLFQQQFLKTGYVIDDTSPSGAALATGFMNEWQKQGGRVLDHRSVASTSSYVSLLTQIAATKPDLIFYAGSDTTGGTLTRQQMLQVVGLQNKPLAGGEGIHTTAFATRIGLTGGPVYSTAIGVDVTALHLLRQRFRQHQPVDRSLENGHRGGSETTDHCR